PDSISISGDTLTIIPPSTPTYEELIGYNIYLDGTLLAFINQPVYILSLQPGIYTMGISAVYEDGESAITTTTFVILDIFNPPQNVQYEIIDDHVHLTWDDPAPGSTSPFENFRIYVDGNIYEETLENQCDIFGLINGLIYEIAVTAIYEAGESEIYPFEIIYTGNDVDLENISIANSKAYPNPFSYSTTISYYSKALSIAADVQSEIEIFNIKGRSLRQFKIHHEDIGKKYRINSVIWDGKESNGSLVSSGIYFYQIKIDNKIMFMNKLLLIR
ncbi:MAG: T9SS type A sorting domain-containing protein, partial [Candidatus Cloacimonadota bacterium]|nr:T9SS type A sorting domain-containing protein [Candidatus Cloacimonadota bacterium]